MLCLILSILLSLKKFWYCWFIFQKKRILSHITPGVPPRKSGFSWYAVRAIRPERVQTTKRSSCLLVGNRHVAECFCKGMYFLWSFYFLRELKSLCLNFLVELKIIFGQMYPVLMARIFVWVFAMWIIMYSQTMGLVTRTIDS